MLLICCIVDIYRIRTNQVLFQLFQMMFPYVSIVRRDLPYQTQHLDPVILTRVVSLYLEECRSEFSEVPSQCCILVCMLTVT